VTHEVMIRLVDARPTAVVAARTRWRGFAALWPQLSGEVWACLRAGGITSGCPNVMLYADLGAEVDVEVGVILEQPCPLTGRVESSTLPAGRVAMTVHRGDYSGLDSAHRDIAEWCAAHGHPVTSIRWEVYGPHSDVPSTEVFWLLED
jgi:effector-binding domain-containing protein